MNNSYGYLTPRLAPSKKATVHDIIWAAGFYEGEGSCSFPSRSEKASIPQKDIWTLNKMRVLFGGTVFPSGNIHRWHITGARARGFLMTIYGLLSPRRQKQIRRALRVTNNV